MSQYIKNGVIYNNLTTISLNGKQIINPKERQILEAGYEVYVAETAEKTLEDVINDKISDLEVYANSNEMNSYVAQGVTIRLPLELRLRLRNVIDAKIALGQTILTEWYNDVAYTYPLSAWDAQLTQYEDYLYEVSCVAMQHKQNIKVLTTIDGVNAYDFTTGYPERLDFGTYDDGSSDAEA